MEKRVTILLKYSREERYVWGAVRAKRIDLSRITVWYDNEGLRGRGFGLGDSHHIYILNWYADKFSQFPFLLMISNIDLGKMKTFCPKTKLYYKSTSSYFNFGCKHFEIVSSNKIQQRRKDFVDWTIHNKQKATFDIFNGSYNAKFQNSFSKKTSSSSLCWTLIITFINTNTQIYGTL